MQILIVGGGIAGSTLAYTLLRAGVDDIVVAEARAGVNDIEGAFLSLAPNGINALRAIGLGDVPTAAGGFEVSGIDFHNAKGRRIAQLSGEDDKTRYGARTTVIRRARLHAELGTRAQQAGATILFGARLVALHQRPAGIMAEFADGRTIEADVVIGADGVWSTVRRLTWPNAPTPSYTGIVDCGGWTRVDRPDTARQQMYFGRRAFFGFTIKDSQSYWFTNVPQAEEPKRNELDGLDQDVWMSTIRRLHADDPGPVRDLLDAASSSLGAWPVYDMPDLPAWNTDRVCLMGDAAHAVSPSSGQGASLGIEDAVVMARWLSTAPTPAAAFQGFVQERKARAEKIVRYGRQIGNRKVSSAAGNIFRDLTLGFFLRLGAKATTEQYSYRTPEHHAVNGH